MRHHLWKAKEIYADNGLLSTAESALRYLPIEINNLIFRSHHGPGTHVMDEDWDNLLILDACRYDMFAARVSLDGELESRISLGSSSEEFMERNFLGKTFHDTVYVNANPYLVNLELDQGTFHAVVDCLSEWDAELETVPPETVAEAARATRNEFPEKRLIVHFMQPHTPFIGEIGQEISGGSLTMTDDDSGPSFWDQLRDGEIKASVETVWEAYTENLDVALEEVAPLLDALGGKSVVTADHGNLVGERLLPIPTRRKYGHPYGVHTEKLVKVPWFVTTRGPRRTVTEEPPVKQESIAEDTIKDRLEALGYA